MGQLENKYLHLMNGLENQNTACLLADRMLNTVASVLLRHLDYLRCGSIPLMVQTRLTTVGSCVPLSASTGPALTYQMFARPPTLL